MMYLTIIFTSPLYFLIRRRWLGFMLNAFFYGIACLLLITFVLAFLAPLPWALAVGHAGWHLRKELMQQHAAMIATAVRSSRIPGFVSAASAGDSRSDSSEVKGIYINQG